MRRHRPRVRARPARALSVAGPPPPGTTAPPADGFHPRKGEGSDPSVVVQMAAVAVQRGLTPFVREDGFHAASARPARALGAPDLRVDRAADHAHAPRPGALRRAVHAPPP